MAQQIVQRLSWAHGDRVCLCDCPLFYCSLFFACSAASSSKPVASVAEPPKEEVAVEISTGDKEAIVAAVLKSQRDGYVAHDLDRSPGSDTMQIDVTFI